LTDENAFGKEEEVGEEEMDGNEDTGGGDEWGHLGSSTDIAVQPVGASEQVEKETTSEKDFNENGQ
jgi:hypothetical protein